MHELAHAQVSSNHRMREECLKGAKYLAKLLESLGADVKVVRWVILLSWSWVVGGPQPCVL